VRFDCIVGAQEEDAWRFNIKSSVLEWAHRATKSWGGKTGDGEGSFADWSKDMVKAQAGAAERTDL